MTRRRIAMLILPAATVFAVLLTLPAALPANDGKVRGNTMLSATRLMAFLSSSDLARTRHFYHDVLGLKVLESNPMVVVLEAGGTQLRVSKVETPVVAPYTVLGWSVVGIADRVAELTAKGIAFQRYPGLTQDTSAIATFPNGDRVAWFKDPEGHILSLTEFSRK
jgi:catechol 2,3-dioxygenase-like lactoylglutathione lyase family enzyme